MRLSPRCHCLTEQVSVDKARSCTLSQLSFSSLMTTTLCVSRVLHTEQDTRTPMAPPHIRERHSQVIVHGQRRKEGEQVNKRSSHFLSVVTIDSSKPSVLD